MTDRCDVVVVGAGFAGITAARELTLRGHQVVVVEGRDRIGGRTWTDDRLDLRLELGGTWVHWLQPHVWTEISRYGLAIKRMPDYERAHWLAGGECHSGTMDDLWSVVGPGIEAVVAQATAIFPRPYAPLANDAVVEADRFTIEQKYRELGLDERALELNEGMWASNFSGYPADGAWTQGLRWMALGMGHIDLMWEPLVTYKLQDGTAALIRAIAAEATADLRLGTPVRAIRQDGAEVDVELEDGSSLVAASAIVTAPINALRGIAFEPALPEAARAVIAQGQASQGVKVWARLRGRYEPFQALAGNQHPLVTLLYDSEHDGDAIVVGFGADGTRLDGDDPAEVQDAIRIWLPDADVVASAGHDWTADRFSRETYAMLRPGQLTGGMQALKAPHGRVVIAGSDYADGWSGFIDGAIEGGIRAAQTVHAMLAGTSPGRPSQAGAVA